MKCTKCGAFAPDEASFCPECGAPIQKFDIGKTQPVNYNDYQIPTVQKNNNKYILIAVCAAVVGLAIILGGITVGYNIFVRDKSTPSPSPSASPTATTAATELTTYYVVNCDTSITLRETPQTTGVKITDIPLGDPVSYVKAAENGFAEIIYNGTTGYALQAYLSTNPPVVTEAPAATQPPAPPNHAEPPHADEPPARGIVKYPTYRSYYDSYYGFSCNYPSHFRVYNDSDKFVRYSLYDPNSDAILKICATDRLGRSPQTIKDNFVATYPGTIDYQNGGSDWCVISTYAYGQRHYGYFNMRKGYIRGFEFHSSYDYDTNDRYINEIYDSLNFN